MTGTQLAATLTAQGATLHLSATGKLVVRPSVLLQAPGMREAVAAHLPYLLVCAAVAEVQRVMRTAPLERLAAMDAWQAAVALNAACEAGDVEATRQAAVAYVAAWAQWVEGGEAHRDGIHPV